MSSFCHLLDGGHLRWTASAIWRRFSVGRVAGVNRLAERNAPCGGSGLLGKSRRDAALDIADTEGARPVAVRSAAVIAMLFLAGCAPLFVLPSLQPGPFLLLNLAYLGLAIFAGALVLGAQRLACITGRTDGPDEGQRRWLIGAIIATAVTLSHFQVFKQLVLPGRGVPLDALIADLEHRLLFGHDAWEVTHMLFGALLPTLILDTAYAVWLPIMFLFPAAVVIAIRDQNVRGRLVGTWVVSWILIGSLGAWGLASAGPCYFNELIGPHAGYVRMHEALMVLDQRAAVYGLNVQALHFQEMLRQSQGGPLVFASGISAMPSMHVAMATLFVIGAFQHSRKIGWCFFGYAMLIWIASIHLGWHYASDGLLGAAMMAGLWVLSGPASQLIYSGLRAKGLAKTRPSA